MIDHAQGSQGLYAAVLGGVRIANPGGWVSVVTTRRAIDEHRARQRAQCRSVGAAGADAKGMSLRSAVQERGRAEHDSCRGAVHAVGGCLRAVAPLAAGKPHILGRHLVAASIIPIGDAINALRRLPHLR
jgi:hypothetical protein